MAAPASRPRLAPAVSRALKRRHPETALYEQVAERLRQRILGHQLGAGSWIDEQALALEFGISRTPLREALKVLASEGLVTMKLRRGAYVTEVSERDLAEVFHLLALLESDAAGAAANAATEEQMHDLERLHQALEASVGERDRFFAANERFHLRLLEVAGNRWAGQVVADLRKVMKLNRHHSLFKQGRLEASLLEHRAIMAALLARDASQARKLMQEHITNGKQAAGSGAAP
jgi:DNA-binding GntR family transcriptional regulator